MLAKYFNFLSNQSRMITSLNLDEKIKMMDKIQKKTRYGKLKKFFQFVYYKLSIIKIKSLNAILILKEWQLIQHECPAAQDYL